MSDPVTNAEVEDVLSSIRRLVSEDKRPMNRTQTAKPAEDKLVLTPSLRVSNDAPLVDAYKKPQQDAIPTEWGDERQEDTAALGDNSADNDPADDMDDTIEGADTAPDQGTAFDTSNGNVDHFHFYDSSEEFEDADLIADDVEDGTALGETVDDQRSDGSDTAETPVPDSVGDRETSSLHRRTGVLNLGASELVEDEPASPDKLSAKIAALEKAISRIPENWEPDGQGDDDYSGSRAPAMAWEDDVDLDATGVPISNLKEAPRKNAAFIAPSKQNDADEVDEDDSPKDHDLGGRHRGDQGLGHQDLGQRDSDKVAADSQTGLGGGADEYIDEEMLRDLVSEIVRTELQGALGERITRNVRKLVRREIHRALTAQDLE